MIEAFLDWKGVNYRDVNVLNEDDNPRIWGTSGEIQAFYKYAHQCGDMYSMHIVSHWWHIPRLWYLCKKLGINPRLHGARGSNKGILYELYKLPGQILSDLLKRGKK